VAHIERRRIQRRDSSGRLRVVTRYRVRYRDESGKQHCETKVRLVDAERRKAEIEDDAEGRLRPSPVFRRRDR
jgi:hypothetical protein